MFKTIQTILNLKKEMSDAAIGYVVTGPFESPFPDELIKTKVKSELNDAKAIEITTLRIDNFSPKTHSNIRVLYSGEYDFSPQVRSSRGIYVNYLEDTDTKEIRIEEILPKNTIVVCFFNTTDDFDIEDVIVDGVRITPSMQRLASAYRYPIPKKLLLAYIMLGLISILTFYSIFSVNKNLNIRNELYHELGFRQCKIFNLEANPEKADELQQAIDNMEFYTISMNLKLNQVDTLEDLAKKEKVVICPY